MTTYQVTVSQTPSLTLSVSEAEALSLYRQGLIVTSSPAIPPSTETRTDRVISGGAAGARGSLIQLRAATSAEWAAAESAGPLLVLGEFAVVTNETALVRGDGSTKVASLPRFGGGSTIDGGTP